MSVPREVLFDKVRQWVEYAEEDFHAAHESVRAAPPLSRIAAFHAQQCAEKYLKALLVRHETDFPFTHNLSVLLDLNAKWLAASEELHDVVSLNVYAVSLRYPGVAETVTVEEAQAAIVMAEKVRRAVRATLAKEGMDMMR